MLERPSSTMHFTITSLSAACPITNINCRSPTKIKKSLHARERWENMQMTLSNNRLTDTKLALRLTWGVTWHLSNWSKLSNTTITSTISRDMHVPDLVQGVDEEFYGDTINYPNHGGNLFLFQWLCNLHLKEQHKCIIKNLLYKTKDPCHPIYIRHYVRSHPYPKLVLMDQYFAYHSIYIEDLSLEGVDFYIDKALREECIKQKAQKLNNKKKMLNASLSNTILILLTSVARVKILSPIISTIKIAT